MNKIKEYLLDCDLDDVQLGMGEYYSWTIDHNADTDPSLSSEIGTRLTLIL